MKVKNKKLFFSGISIVVAGIVILGVFGWKRISSEVKKHILMKKCVVLEIPDVDIKIPVVEGTDGENLHIASGHFENTGSVGFGNYCIAGHNSTIYAEVFNNLSEVRSGSEIFLTDNDENHTRYKYIVTDTKIVNPEDTWVLQDYGDDRITIVTCTDDGKQRFIVTGMKKQTWNSLRKAHQNKDRAVMQAYGFSIKMTESECVAELMKMYQKLIK